MFLCFSLCPAPAQSAPALIAVTTYHYDNARTGQNTNETVLTPANVNTTSFGRLFSYAVDGQVYAEPLCVPGLVIPGQGTHNVVFVATQHNSVYAFDADSNARAQGGLLWHVSLGASAATPNNDFGNRYGSYHDIRPEVGITSTPVIDLSRGLIYVDAFTHEGASYFHRVHALNVTNGAEQSYSPVVVSASVPGVGVGSSGGVLAFNPQQHLQRPALTLAGGMLFVAYSGYADTDPYHGWVIGFNSSNLQQVANYVFNTTPNATTADFGANAGEGGIWMSGNGLSVDTDNNLYFEVGNGSFNADTTGGTEYGDSFVKLSTAGALTVADYFTPYDQAALAAGDLDLGSGGPFLLPDSVGSAAHPHLIAGCGKEGTIYLLDRDNLGQFNSAGDSQIVQELSNAVGGTWSSGAYFNNLIFYQGRDDVLKSFPISNGLLGPTPVSQSTTSFGFPGATPVISANGTNDAIAWVIQSDGYPAGPAILHAYNAYNLGQELYNSTMAGARDNPGGAIKFTVPTVANGKVYVGTAGALSVFGTTTAFVASPVIAPNGGVFTNSVTVTLSDATAGATIYYTLDNSIPTTNSTRYTVQFVVTNSLAVKAKAFKPGAVDSAVTSATFLSSTAIGQGIGLTGSYYANQLRTFNEPPTLVRIDPTINFNWNNNSPDPSISMTDYTVRWTGSLQPQFNETYTFYTTTDDGVRLWVNNRLIINEWIDQAPAEWSGALPLVAGQRYDLKMEYYQNQGGAVAYLSWASPSTLKAIIPATQLYPTNQPPPTVTLTSPTNGATLLASTSIPLSASATEHGGIILSVDFYTNGTLLGTVSNSPYNLTVASLPAGSYAITAAATDAAGITSTSSVANISVISVVLPVAKFVGSPVSGAEPLAVVFTDSSTGTITNRFWDFGDGANSNTTSTVVAHTYGAAGTNTVALTVSGPVGTNSLRQANYIVVTNPGPVVLTVQLLGNKVRLTWSSGTLQTAAQAGGPYADTTNTVSPFDVTLSGAARFFRVRVR